MIKFNQLDFRLCQIPEKNRECYLYIKDGHTYISFDLEYVTEIAEQCESIKLKKLQATNYLYVNFKKKRIVDAKHKVFELTEPTEKD